MYKIAICEDDQAYISTLKNLIVSTGVVTADELLFYPFFTGEDILWKTGEFYDLVIMDMQMDKMSGYETAVKLREKDENFLLVFCSGTVMPSNISFRVNPFRYLLKSQDDDELLSDMTDIMKKVVEQKKYPFVMCKHGLSRELARIEANCILYLEISREKTEVHIWGKAKEKYGNELLREHRSLRQLSEIFTEEYGFARIHHSYIVNMEYVENLDSDNVVMADQTCLPIARSKAKEFREEFARFVAAKYKG